jgi:glycine cleavage system regulatory protein
MFQASARLSCPEGLTVERLRTTLERLAGELMVDITVNEEEAKGADHARPRDAERK